MNCLFSGAITRIGGAQKRAGGVASVKYSVSHFENQQACTAHSHDNNSRGKNLSRYHNQAGKSSGHICSL